MNQPPALSGWQKWGGRILLLALFLYLAFYFLSAVEDLFRLGCF